MSVSISETHEWRMLNDFRKGDWIHRWGDDLEVTRIEPQGTKSGLFYMDTDKQEKSIVDRSDSQYLARKRAEEMV